MGHPWKFEIGDVIAHCAPASDDERTWRVIERTETLALALYRLECCEHRNTGTYAAGDIEPGYVLATSHRCSAEDGASSAPIDATEAVAERSLAVGDLVRIRHIGPETTKMVVSAVDLRHGHEGAVEVMWWAVEATPHRPVTAVLPIRLIERPVTAVDSIVSLTEA